MIVATVRALKLHGGVPMKDLHKPNVEALDKGVENLKKHIENIHRFGLPVVVAINHFSGDTDRGNPVHQGQVRLPVGEDHHGRPLGPRRRRRGGTGPGGGRRGRQHQDRLLAALPRHLHALAEGGHHLPRDLRRHRRAGRQEAPRQVPPTPGGGLRPPADLHGEDAVFACRPIRCWWAGRRTSTCRCGT